MISVPRALCREIAAVFRAVGRGRSAESQSVEWTADGHGLTARMAGPDGSVCHHQPGRRPDARLVVPLSALADGSGSPTVTFRSGSKGPSASMPFPVPPKRFTPASSRLLAALEAGASVAARDEPGRYVLNRIQLRGGSRGAIVASDARQLLVQTGFAFPWPGDALVSRSGIFTPLAIRASDPVAVARTATHVWIRTGPWSVALAIDSAGRFPETDAYLSRSAKPGTEWSFDKADRDRLLREIPRLPGADRDGRPITLDFGRKCVGAEGKPGTPATIVLPASQVRGCPVRLICNRTYLLAALKFGFLRVSASTPDQPLVWRDEARTYLYLPIAGEPPESKGFRESGQAAEGDDSRTATSHNAGKESAKRSRARVPQQVVRPIRSRKHKPAATDSTRTGGAWSSLWIRVRGIFRRG